MAQRNPAVPSWMSEVKEDTTKTNEWNELTKHIYEAVDQHLSQSHVSYFTDLTEAEKSLLLERAARSLASSDGGRVYENLQSKLSYLLDQSVNNQVAKRMLEDSPIDTKTDLVLDATSEGIIALLRKHPDQKYKLRVFLNQIIPQPIRFLGYQLFYANSNHRKNFVTKLTTNPKLCLSSQDTEIQRKTEFILNANITFKEIRESKGMVNSMKGILSYYHTQLNKRSLCDAEYHYAVPIVYAHYPPLPKAESPTQRSMGMLIEIYLQFIDTLSSAILQAINGVDDNPEMGLIIKNTIDILEQYDQPLIEYIKDVSRKDSPSGIEDITFQTAFKSICLPLVKNLFSGYLSLNPLMFVWDQYLISADIPGYHDELTSAIAAIIFMSLRDLIMLVISMNELDDCLKQQSKFIQTRQLQTIFNKYFFRSLQGKINSFSRVGPVIDPTAGRLQPWEHWHQDIIPRRKVLTREPNDSEDRVKAEINRRLMGEKQAQEEIERLRREVESLRNRPQPRQAAYEPRPVVEPEPVVRQKTKPVNTNDAPFLDLLSKVKSSTEKLQHGDGIQRKALDSQTREDLNMHKLDLKMAEKQVFGHQLNPREWEMLSDKDKKVKSEQMLKIVNQRLQKRFKDTGRF